MDDDTQSVDVQAEPDPMEPEPERERWFTRHPKVRNAAIVFSVVAMAFLGWFAVATFGVMAGEARLREAASAPEPEPASPSVAELARKRAAEKKALASYYPSTDAVPALFAESSRRIEGGDARPAAAAEPAANRQVAPPPPPLPAPTTTDDADAADTADDADDPADDPADTSVPALPTTGLGPDQ